MSNLKTVVLVYIHDYASPAFRFVSYCYSDFLLSPDSTLPVYMLLTLLDTAFAFISIPSWLLLFKFSSLSWHVHFISSLAM